MPILILIMDASLTISFYIGKLLEKSAFLHFREFLENIEFKMD